MLTARAQNGDMDAFAAVFEPLRPTVYAVACRLVGPSDAEDVVMETFLKAWQAIPRFNRHSSLKTWLYRITYNCAVDRIRARQRLRETPLDDEADGGSAGSIPDDSAPRPDEVLAGSETIDRVRSAMGRLPAEHRTALLLRFSDGLSYAGIAAATGVSIGTVMSRLFNGKRKLRRILEEEAP